MKKIETEIEIHAPIEKVWEVLTDFNNWEKWNPIVYQAHGKLLKDSKVDIIMYSGKNNLGHKYSATLTEITVPKSLQWNAIMMAGFLFTNGKIFKLHKTESGTKLIHSETFKGILVPMFWKKLNQGVPKMLSSMNKALKEAVEKSEK